jgi:hypothetical protein
VLFSGPQSEDMEISCKSPLVSRSPVRLLAALGAIFLFAEPLVTYAQLLGPIWTNPGKGNWFTRSNWTPAGVPGSTQNASVTTGIAQILGGTAVVSSLAIGGITGPTGAAGTVEIGSGNSLIANNGLTINVGGTLQVDSGAHFQISSSFVNNGGTIDNFGLITGGVNFGAGGGNLTNETGGQIIGNLNLGNGTNTVQLFTGSSVNGNLNLGANVASKLVLDGIGTQNLSQAITGSVSVAGSLTKQGSGTWNIDEALTIPGSTNVGAGTLLVSQTLTTPTLSVQSGAELTGPGTIVGNVVNFGLLSTGSIPATLKINGNLALGPTSILNIQLASPTSFSRLFVNGRLNLGGILQITLLNGFKPLKGLFTILDAVQGITGKFINVVNPSGVPFQVKYAGGVVNLVVPAKPREQAPQLGDGTPVSGTATLAKSTFFGFGTPAERSFAINRNSLLGVSFDAAEFDIRGQKGQTYTLPISGAFKISDRVRLDYVVPLQWVKLPNVEFFQAGLTLDVPIHVVPASYEQPFSWDVTPTLAFAEAGDKEWIGGGALSNLFSYRVRNITFSYGNYLSFFEGHRWTVDDVNFNERVSQQIMKNGLKITAQFGEWFFDTYGIYTQYFQSAAISSYYTIGGEVGRHFVLRYQGVPIDLGLMSVGLYTEQGNGYSSSGLQFGSAWRF